MIPNSSGWVVVPVPGRTLLQYPMLKGWQKDLADGHLSVLSAREDGLWHLSISHRTNAKVPKPGRYPTWDEIKDARYRFAPPDITLAMLLPPMEEYVNIHETTFHLHEIP